MTHMTAPRDRFQRPMGSLRISVTDRCNLRCSYCMPEEEYVWLPRESILTFEEIELLAEVFVSLGATRLRVTGGEPLLRRDVPELVARLSSVKGIEDLALTTNGILLDRFAEELARAGLQRVTVSLDTLRPERFAQLTRRSRLEEVFAGLEALDRAGFTGTKLNSVVVRRFNDDELVDLVRFGSERGIEVRFIEYMDVGGATRWASGLVVSRKEILSRIEQQLGDIEEVPGRGAAPAERFRLADGTVFGIVGSTTAPFCSDCDRSRLTADGMWLLCLYADEGVDLRQMVRDGATREELARKIGEVWSARVDRGAEQRVADGDRQPLYQIASLKSDPHREMHTRGG